MPDGTDAPARPAVLQRWQRKQLRQRIPALVAQWEPAVGRTVPKWSVRRMKTKWMAHLRERGHGDHFTAIMDRRLPDWRARRDALNRAPLAEEDWQVR